MKDKSGNSKGTNRGTLRERGRVPVAIAAVALLIGTTLAIGGAPPAPGDGGGPFFTYTVKWTCFLPTPSTPSVARAFGLVPGEYRTAITLYNPFANGPLAVDHHFVIDGRFITVAGGEVIYTDGESRTLRSAVGAGRGAAVDICDLLREGVWVIPRLGDFSNAHGYLVLRATAANLEVYAQYTSLAYEKGSVTTSPNTGISTDVERISPMECPAPCTLGEKKPIVSVTAADSDAHESGDPGTFTVSLDAPTASAVDVSFTLGGSATEGSDYTLVPRQVLIPAGSTTVDVTVLPIDDTRHEGDETVVFILNGTNDYDLGASTQATVTIHESRGR